MVTRKTFVYVGSNPKYQGQVIRLCESQSLVPFVGGVSTRSHYHTFAGRRDITGDVMESADLEKWAQNTIDFLDGDTD